MIFVQVFRGHPEYGHWALLIVDWMVWKSGILVFFDSLPSYSPQSMENLKDMFLGTPLAPKGCKWIRASMPEQGCGTMDCGIWMSCIAASYVKGLLERNLIMPGLDGKGDMSLFSHVKALSSNDDSTSVGGTGRDHMLKTIQMGKCNFDDDTFFHLLSIHWAVHV